MADQLTAFALSAYGNAVTKTPFLDSFAQRAAVFENAYCNYPLCAPSRFALMSGRLPSRIAAYDNAAEFPASVPTLAHYLRDAGYYTCLSGKMHFVGPDQHHGYEQRLTTEIYPADFSWTPPDTYEELPAPGQTDGPAPGVSSVETITDAGPKVRSMQMDYDDEVIHRACQHLYDRTRHGDDRPLFMTVSFTQPHDPYVSRKEFWDLYTDEQIDQPRVPPIPPGEMDPHSLSLYYHYSLDKFDVTDDIYRRARRGYYAMISDIDQKFGKLLASLEDCGMTDDTVVIFTSDHGDMIGERGLWFKKNLFDPALRVPLMMHWPNKTEPVYEKTAVSLLDILPTLLEVAGVPESQIATPLEGVSLFQRLSGADQPVYAEHLDGGTRAPRVMLRSGDLKLVHSLEYPTQLYHLGDDPDERDNLATRPDWKAETDAMLSQVNSVWDLASLKRDVVNNQKVRQLLASSLGKGRKFNWEHHPEPAEISSRWVREGDLFPEVEQRGYLPYPHE